MDTSVLDMKYMSDRLDNPWIGTDLLPKFTVSEGEYTKEYISAFGPVYNLDKLRFPGRGVEEYRIAVARQIALRNPSEEGFSARLTRAQKDIEKKHRNQLFRFKNHLLQNLEIKHPEESYYEWLHEPMPKRELRRKTHKEALIQGGNYMDDNRPVEYKLKNGELLADSKKRGIGDMGVNRTDVGAHVMGGIKQAWSIPFEHNLMRTVFVKTSTKVNLRKAFDELLHPGNKTMFYYHSDDSCVSANCLDGYCAINGDIKQCDGSHFTPMFNALEKLITNPANGNSRYLRRVFKQCTSKMRVRNQHKGKRNQSVTYKFTTARLYSGSSLTTIINNFANWNIAMAFEKRVPNPMLVTKDEFCRQYVLAGEDCGYWLRFTPCEKPSELQFLKHSPCVGGMGVEPWMNLGTYIRGFGMYKGDLPGSGAYRKRAEFHVSDVVYSRRQWGKHDFNRAFNHLLINGRDAVTADIIKSEGECLREIDRQSILDRYKLSIAEYEELCTHIRTSHIGSVTTSELLDRIYRVDYG